MPVSSPLQPGRPWPLGASVVDGGVNLALPAAHATQVDWCLFDSEGRHETARHALPARSGDVWHGWLPGAQAGLVYALRVHGPWRPDRGHRHNPNKLLLDPWAREIVGRFEWRPEHFGADPQHPGHQDGRDNATWALKARVVDDRWSWDGDRRPQHASPDLVLYEAHVRSFSRRLRGVPEHERGTYLGLASDAGLNHLKQLGVTAVSLLPVHQHLDEQRLTQLGLVNHWGYNTIGYFCPSPRLATRADGRTARDEFRTMVQRLHGAGIEVLLDVVYNHTAEADAAGPTLSWRGLDNATWYRLPPEHRSGYENWTGCGNTLDLHQPRVLQFVLDSLRYWVGEMHVDGFRFDLAPVLGRGARAFDARSAFFQAVQQDPLLAGVRLIAEPWDLGPDGYQLGQFPAGWQEWNDRFRDTARAFWLGHGCTRGEFARRLAGSSDLFQAAGRLPNDSVNFIVAHDGFTLHDLVSYRQRHNQANGEDNRDGHGHNLGDNSGVEGPTRDAQVLQRRARRQRALLATLLLAQGTPMLAAGSEIGHSQRGNNNAYCQDNAVSWLDWDAADADLLAFTTHALALRRERLPLGTRWYTGLPDGRGLPDLAWSGPDGATLDDAAWHDSGRRALAAFIGRPGRPGPPLLLLVNGDATDHPFVLPDGTWRLLLDSTQPRGDSAWRGRHACHVPAGSLLLLEREG